MADAGAVPDRYHCLTTNSTFGGHDSETVRRLATSAAIGPVCTSLRRRASDIRTYTLLGAEAVWSGRATYQDISVSCSADLYVDMLNPNAISFTNKGILQTSKKTVSRSPCRKMSNLSSPFGSGKAMSVARRACSPMEHSTGSAALAAISSGK